MGNFFEKNSCLEKKDNAADAEENRENARSCRQKVLYAAGLAGGLYAVLRYLLPLVAPFVFAFFIVRILYPQLCRAEKRLRIRKDILMAGFLLLLTGILAAGFFFLLSKGTAWAVKIGSESGAIKDQVNIAFENGCCRAEELLGREQGEIRTFFQDKGDEMAKTVGREILPKAADWTAKSCSFALRTGAFWGIGMIAAFWLCRDYARFSEWMKKSEIWENIDRILRMTGGYCRAQLKILVIISGITVLGLWIGKVRNGLWIGLLAGILDALPMIGTGIVLIPTAIWQLLNENPQGAAFASVTYVACIAARAVKIGSESGAIKDQVNIAFENGCCRAEELLGREQGEIRTFFQDKGDEMAKTVGREILPKAADWTAKSCSFALRTGAFWGIGMIAAFWLCRDYARFSEWMKKSEIWENIDRILRMTGGYCRAQLKILVIISGITVLGLWIGKVRNGLWIGLLAGILDALPMIGTGIVLIPTAIWQLLNENPQGAAFASVTYVACIAARELLEPRLLGAQIGLPPVLMLLSVYAGVKVFGAGGIFLGPLYTVLYTEGLRQIFCRS